MVIRLRRRTTRKIIIQSTVAGCEVTVAYLMEIILLGWFSLVNSLV